MLQTRSFAVPGPLLITPRRHEDARGFFSETFNARAFAQHEIAGPFVQDNHVLSRERGVIRGLHFQVEPSPQGKLIRVLKGAILDVAVDIRTGSPTFGQHVAVELSAENWQQLWVPIGFAHGYCTLTSDTEVAYKVTGYYDPSADRGLAFDDPEIGIDWPVRGEDAILSDKDRRQPALRDLGEPFRYAG